MRLFKKFPSRINRAAFDKRRFDGGNLFLFEKRVYDSAVEVTFQFVLIVPATLPIFRKLLSRIIVKSFEFFVGTTE